MAKIFNGRYTTQYAEDVTVFLIGMRFNRWWLPHTWLPVFLAMPLMLRRLETQPEFGFLGYHIWYGRTLVMVRYWKSPEHLQDFASASDQPHVAAWQRYTKRVGDSGSVGLYHETYVTSPADRESMYVNMPLFGLARATGGHTAVNASLETARQRLAGPR